MDDNLETKTHNNRMTDDTASRKRLFRLLPLLVLVLGAVFASWLMGSGPKAKPRPKERNATLVEVAPVVVTSQATRVSAMGTVRPSRIIDLKPQVNGEVLRLHPDFIPGGHLDKGTVLLEIDPVDYQLAVRQQESELARVKAEIQLEQGNQLVAQKEYELLGETVSPEEQLLMLRQPQLASLQASLDAARARLDQARLDLERTSIKVPFNAVVEAREVNLGARVNTATTLAMLVGTDTYWVEAAVPVNQLRWIKIPQADDDQGARVRIYNPAAWGRDIYREGEVVRLAAGLEEQGRMAQLLIRVDDPLALKREGTRKPAMLLDAYVRLDIEGETLNDVVAIDRQLIRDNDTVWIMDDSGHLDIRPVEIVFRGRDQVLIKNSLVHGEKLVITTLSTPVPGMTLRLNEPLSATTGLSSGKATAQ